MLLLPSQPTVHSYIVALGGSATNGASSLSCIMPVTEIYYAIQPRNAHTTNKIMYQCSIRQLQWPKVVIGPKCVLKKMFLLLITRHQTLDKLTNWLVIGTATWETALTLSQPSLTSA